MTAVPQCVTEKVCKKYMYPCNIQINRCQYVDMTRQRVTVYQKFRCIFSYLPILMRLSKLLGSTILNCLLVSPVHTDKNMIRFRQIVRLKWNYHWFHGLRNLAGKKGESMLQEFDSMRVDDAQGVGALKLFNENGVQWLLSWIYSVPISCLSVSKNTLIR